MSTDSCVLFAWSPSTVDSLEPTRIVAIIAIIIHGLFWIEFCVFPSLRQRTMVCLFVYLITDFLLLSRFFILYGIRVAELCLYTTGRDVLCYFEASSKFYMNTVQSYLMLAFNLCRYAQIVSNRNVYIEKPRWIWAGHLLIGVLPILNVLIQFVSGLAHIWRRRGGSCDIQYLSPLVQVFNILVTFVVPVSINVIIIALDIRHVSSVRGVASEQIIRLRRKRQRTLLLQTIAFYSVWLILWSPDILAFQFINVNTDPAIVTSLLSYIGIALDPIIIAILDIRFLTPWRTVWNRIKGRGRIGILQKPAAIMISPVNSR
jgi:hypothetical protein